jgi:hypothetical protein
MAPSPKKESMKKIVYLLLLLVSTGSFAQTQAADETSITEIINKLFTGMHNHDTVMVRSAFGEQVTLATVVRNREGKHVLRLEEFPAFIKSIGQPSPESLTEEIWNLKIQIDGAFAQAWCDYGFYIGKKFSHCGVDAFQLIKTTEGWKIFNIADTRRRDGCNVPEEIQKKYK